MIYVVKRDGRKEPIDYEKINKVLMWAAEGLKGVSPSTVGMQSNVQIVDSTTTSEIHEVLIKTASDMISEEIPDYAIYAGRLAIFHLRKKAYGQYEPPRLYDHVKKVVEAGRYTEQLLVQYSESEWDELEKSLNHDLDLELAYAAVKQFEGKYLLKHRVTGEIYESPQMALIVQCATMFMEDPNKEKRLSFVKRKYEALSQHKISLPTPIMGGLRTPTKQFSSCVLIESDDSLKSINATASSIVEYVSQRAGIGINGGAIRALGSEIRGGEGYHTGVIPFWKYFQTAVKSCSQGGIRGGAATLFYPLWHREFPSLVVLKNNRGIEENRVRHLDYGVQLNRLMYERLQRNQNITLFSPSDVPGLYESFFADQKKFEKLYLKYEQDPNIKKETYPALELFTMLMNERASTGRIYIQNVDHCNTAGSFLPEVAPVRQSNLCLEIALPTKPLKNIEDPEGEIALCTLAAFNLGKLQKLEDLEELAYLVVRGLDNLLTYQDYPVKAGYTSTMKRRALGVGVINYAYYLAKNGVKYSDGSANDLTHRLFEAIQFYCLKASMELAKERGTCDGFDETKYSKGILPIDTYKKSVDKHHNQELLLDWEWLREEIKKHGLRNSTLTALMPSETSSQISNATNGIEPPRGLMSVKVSKDGTLRQVVPDIENLRDKYELLWDIGSNTGYLTLVGIMQKFVDQAISANTNYDPSRYESGKVSMNQMLLDLLTAYGLGVKTLYYHNTRDGQKDEQGNQANAESNENEPNATVDVVHESDDECSSCKI
ncbi:class 1a ribonucleoside-diphosphate reductase subunit alpha [Vibrio sp. D431a]|uniref:class 1a ribonucleoside-diphosphate reductase subunit alpha n=1 Tax=Vibrio sp. D431a TaxID=2837388 RepID=UPI002552CE15|nr:class 1a ribonucleoside-diphosphate reductase subunit alpha [Vibrio sp. D431a]MDK9790120.1 ribonucleoside-diphosphate reductase subunit alpha [Vibrio sp. D431a]